MSSLEACRGLMGPPQRAPKTRSHRSPLAGARSLCETTCARPAASAPSHVKKGGSSGAHRPAQPALGPRRRPVAAWRWGGRPAGLPAGSENAIAVFYAGEVEVEGDGTGLVAQLGSISGLGGDPFCAVIGTRDETT